MATKKVCADCLPGGSKVVRAGVGTCEDCGAAGVQLYVIQAVVQALLAWLF